MKRATKIVIAVGSALSLGLAAAAVSAHGFGYGGDWGAHMGGYGMGPGMMGGAGPGYGMGPRGGYGPGDGMGPGAGGGYGPGYGMGPGTRGGNGQGYGMGPGARGGNGQGYGMGPGARGGYGPGYGMGPQAMFGGFSGNAEQRLAGLKTELAITPKQENAWQAFVKSGKQQDEKRQAWFDKMHEARAAASLPERLAQRDEMFKEQQSERQARTAALTELYATLTPEQKTIADRRFGGFGSGIGAGYGRGYGSGPQGRGR